MMDPEPIKQAIEHAPAEWWRPFAIAASGALVMALRFMPGATLQERLVNLLSGTILGGFLAPATNEFFHLEGPRLAAAIAVLWGLLGVSVAQACMDRIRDRFGDLVDRVLGVRK